MRFVYSFRGSIHRIWSLEFQTVARAWRTYTWLGKLTIGLALAWGCIVLATVSTISHCVARLFFKNEN